MLVLFEIYNCWWKDRSYHQYLDTLDEGKYTLPVMNVRKMYVSVSITVQTARSDGHFDRLLVNTRALLCAFYGNIMKLDGSLHVLKTVLHFSDSKSQPDKIDESYEWLWKITTIFDGNNDLYAKYYSPTEHLAADEIIVLFKPRVIFKQQILKKHKWVWDQNLQAEWC